MKRYEAYKPSGVQWIGEIPRHWEVKRLGASFSENRNANSALTNTDAFQFNYGTLIRKKREYKPEEDADVYSKYTLLNPDDIVINGLNLNYDFVSQRVAIAKEEGIITSAYLAMRPRPNVYADYFCFLFKTMDAHKLFHGMGTGIRLTLSFSEVKKQDIPVPPLSEQHAIVDYLKDKTHKIDEYVAARERERELLESLKQSEIANVVTKGLNPNVPMKDSGIPWIGMIPEHWEVKRAKFMFNKEKREVRECDEVITCFRDGQVTLRKNRRTTGFTESFTEIGYQGVRKGDLVIHQMDAFAGSIGVSDSDGKGTSVYHCCTPKGDYDVHYYAFLIRRMAGSGFIQSLYRGIRERSSDFKYPVFGNQYLIVPPLSEQQAIVAYIDEKLSKIDRCLADLQAEIDYLKEFKQRLISDVVTGQICVAEPQKGDKR